MCALFRGVLDLFGEFSMEKVLRPSPPSSFQALIGEPAGAIHQQRLEVQHAGLAQGSAPARIGFRTSAIA